MNFKNPIDSLDWIDDWIGGLFETVDGRSELGCVFFVGMVDDDTAFVVEDDEDANVDTVDEDVKDEGVGDEVEVEVDDEVMVVDEDELKVETVTVLCDKDEIISFLLKSVVLKVWLKPLALDKGELVDPLVSVELTKPAASVVVLVLFAIETGIMKVVA